MKIFKHKIMGKSLPRRVLRGLALYRRASLIPSHCGIRELSDFHIYESTGNLPDKLSLQTYRTSNGYASGKWVMQVTAEQAVKDILDGYSTKNEFFMDKISGWYWRPILKNLPLVIPFFPYMTENAQTMKSYTKGLRYEGIE